MTRTTLKIDEDLLRRLKEKAAREGRSLQSLANDLLRHGLAAPVASDYRLELLTWSGKLQPGVDLYDRAALFDLMEDR
jgi:plasmid stability protein